jgi:hypothetical protein
LSSILDNIEALNSECFTYENYESNWWNLLDIDYVDAMDVDTIKRCVNEFAVGYCDGSRLKLRPREKSYAMMFEKDSLRFWFHIEAWWIDDIDNPIE